MRATRIIAITDRSEPRGVLIARNGALTDAECIELKTIWAGIDPMAEPPKTVTLQSGVTFDYHEVLRRPESRQRMEILK
jgi:hypothetical protein